MCNQIHLEIHGRFNRYKKNFEVEFELSIINVDLRCQTPDIMRVILRFVAV